MDIISHGLWGGIAFGRKSTKKYWTAFLFGILPDLLAFGPFFFLEMFGIGPHINWRTEPPQDRIIPAYVKDIYSFTHSAVIFLAIFLLVWAIRKKPFWQMSSWGLHILMDIPTHSAVFFPTPFLWPISKTEFSGIPWGRPEIMIPDVIALVCLYGYWEYRRWSAKRKAKSV